MDDGTLASKYAKQMSNLDAGFGLKTPHPVAELHPGSLGYLDSLHQWNPILDVADQSRLATMELSSIPDLGKLITTEETWNMQLSKRLNQNGFQCEGKLSAQSLGLPVGVQGGMKYSSAVGFGAIVMCDTTVYRAYYPHERRFKDWLSNNVVQLQQQFPDVDDRGVYLVTRTYASDNVHIAVWDDRNKEIYIWIGANAAGQGELNVSTTKYRCEGTGDFRDFTEGPPDNRVRKVIFFSGVHLRWVRKFPVGKHWKEIPLNDWRGDNEDMLRKIVRMDDSGYVQEMLEVSFKDVGQLSP